ncbi:MAG TPA: hypothetical protein VJ907_07735 [Halanaerobiales bacterium]|nr:hypothetical protein [Halanaerobiales bacterium]
MNIKRFFIKLIVYGLLLFIIFASLYSLFLRDLWVNKGITKTERRMELPGDNYVENPDTVYQQAITINAPADVVWAYLIQVGYQRAGWYNWDFINRWAADNYFYKGNSSANNIILELQSLKEGDNISILPEIAFKVEKLKKNNHLLLTAKEGEDYVVTWAYDLRILQDDMTRLMVRWQSDIGEGFLFDLMNYVITEPGGAGIQQWEMLKGIKKRAERDYNNLNN